MKWYVVLVVVFIVLLIAYNWYLSFVARRLEDLKRLEDEKRRIK